MLMGNPSSRDLAMMLDFSSIAHRLRVQKMYFASGGASRVPSANALFLWEASFSPMAGRLDLKRSTVIDRDGLFLAVVFYDDELHPSISHH
jgi:hypothetical protein